MPITKIVFDTAKVSENVRRQIAAGMESACMHLEGRIVRKINRGQPVERVGKRLIGLDPSKPGEPPKVLYGRLKQSITRQVEVNSDEVVGRVGTNVEYARALELGNPKGGLEPRPYIRNTMEEEREEIARRVLKNRP